MPIENVSLSRTCFTMLVIGKRVYEVEDRFCEMNTRE